MIHNDKFLRMQGQRISNHSHFKKGVVILGGVPDIKIIKKNIQQKKLEIMTVIDIVDLTAPNSFRNRHIRPKYQ